MKKTYKILLTLFCMVLIVSAMVLAVSASDTEGETETTVPKYSILIIGQSNASGRGFSETGYSISDEDIYMWDWDGVHGTKNVWVNTLEPQSTNSGGGLPQNASIGTSFAEAFAREFGESVGIINAAIGGVPIETFKPGNTNYINAVSAAKGAVESGTQIVAILWHQGESNQSSGSEYLFDGVGTEYIDVLENLVNSMIAELGCSPDIPIIAGELTHYLVGSYNIAQAEQYKAQAAEHENWGFARADKLTQVGDGAHLDTLSLRIFGLRYFQAFYEIYTGESAEKYDQIIADMENTLSSQIRSGSMLLDGATTGDSTWSLDFKTGVLEVTGAAGETFVSITSSKQHLYSDLGYTTHRRGISTVSVGGEATSITQEIFKNLEYLEEVIIGDSVTSVHADAFIGCENIKRVVIGSGWADSYSLTPFRDSDLSQLVIVINGEELYPKIVGDFVLNSDGTQLVALVDNTKTSYEIPEGITSIGTNAFADCTNLVSITIPASVTKINSNAFNGCTALETLTFEEGSQLTTIGANAFQNCDLLERVTLPEGLTTIGSYAFYSCDNLKIFDMPTTTYTLGDQMLALCPSLEVIKLGTTNFGSVPDDRISKTDNSWLNVFTHSSSGLTEKEGYQIVYQLINSSEKYYNIPETLKVIIFAGYVDGDGYVTSTPNITSLEAIVLGDDVATVRSDALSGNTNAVVYVTSGFSGKVHTNSALGSTVDGLPVYPTRISSYDVFLGTSTTEYTGTSIVLGNESASWVTEPTIGATTGRVPLPEAADVNAPAKYVLTGWTDGNVTYKSGSAAYVFSNDVTFTAVFTRNYEVTFTSTLEGTTLPEMQYTTNKITLPDAPESPDEDYGFIGWMINGTLYQPGDSVSIRDTFGDDVTITATFVKKWVVSFDGDGVTAESIKTLNTFTFPAEPEAVSEDVVFSGWSADGGETLYQPGDEGTATADITYTAIWSSPVSVTLTGEGVTETTVEWAQGKPYTLPLLPDTAVISGKAFIGWSNGTSIFSGGAEVAINETTTFTAVWRENSIHINAGDFDVSDYYKLTSTALDTLAGYCYDTETETFTDDIIRMGVPAANSSYGLVSYLMLQTYGDSSGGASSNSSTGGYTINLSTGEIKSSARYSYTGTKVTALEQNAFKILVSGVNSSYKTIVKFALPVDGVTVQDAQKINYNYLYSGSYNGHLKLVVAYKDAEGTSGSKTLTSEQAVVSSTESWQTVSFDLTALDKTYTITKLTLTLIDSTDTSIYGGAVPSSGNYFIMGTTVFTPAETSAIKFYTEGAEIEDYTINTMEAFELPAAPETIPEGYYFGGWAADLDGDGENEIYEVGSEHTVTKDTNFYANWIKIPTATFVDGENDAAESITDQNAITLPECTLTAPENYYFAGWSADVDGDGVLETYKAGDEVTITVDTVFTPVWKSIPVATFISDGETLYTYIELEGFEVPAGPTENIPEGTVFAYWSADVDGDGEPEQYFEGDTVIITKDTEFTAQFSELQKVTLNDNENNDGGLTGTTHEEYVAAGVEYTLPAMPETVIEGAQFLGWSNGTTTFDPGTVVEIPESSVTYVAQWFIGATINPGELPLAKDTDGNDVTAFDYTGSTSSSTGPSVYLAGTDFSYQMLGIKHSRMANNGNAYIKLSSGSITGYFYYKFSANLADTDSNGVKDAFHAKITSVPSATSYDQTFALQFNLPIESELTYENAQLITYSYKYNMLGSYSKALELSVTIGGVEYVVKSTEKITDTNGGWDTLTFNLGGTLYTRNVSADPDTDTTKAYYSYTLVEADKSAISNDDLVTNLSLQFVNENLKSQNIVQGDEFYFGEVQLTPFPTATVTVMNGEAKVDEQTVNAPYTLPDEPENSDETIYFGGWSNGTKVYSAGTTVILTKDTVFEAVWIDNFKVDFADGETTVKTEYTHETVTLPTEAELNELGVTAPEGTQLAGWISSADGERYDVGTVVTPTADITYTAEWLTPYTAEFVYNNGTGGSESYPSFDPITVPAAPTPADDTVYFGGWVSSIDGSIVQPGTELTLTADVTYTAKWITKPIASFVAADGTTEAAESQQSQLEITIPEFGIEEPEGKVFAYWVADVDGDGTAEEYHPGDTVTITADTTFTAVYGDKITITINYNDKGATENGTYYIASGEDFELSQLTAERDGYTLIGWSDGTTIYDTNGTIEGVTANVALEAVWEVKAELSEKTIYTDGFTTSPSYSKTLTGSYSTDDYYTVLGQNASWSTGDVALTGDGTVTITYVWGGYRTGNALSLNGVTIMSQSHGSSSLTIGNSDSGGTTATLTETRQTENKVVIEINPATGLATITVYNSSGTSATGTAYLGESVASVNVSHLNNATSSSSSYKVIIEDVKITQMQ